MRPMALFAGEGRTGTGAGDEDVFFQVSNDDTGSIRRTMGEAVFHVAFSFLFSLLQTRASGFGMSQQLMTQLTIYIVLYYLTNICQLFYRKNIIYFFM